MIIKHPVDRVFEFFSRPENLAKITPPKLGFEILTPGPIPMHVGSVIDYTVRILPGVRVQWTTLIAEYEPNKRFVDVQLKGPYSLWHHQHCFEPLSESETKMIDTVTYMMPMGWVGRMSHMLFVKRDIRRIFQYRKQVLSDLLEF